MNNYNTYFISSTVKPWAGAQYQGHYDQNNISYDERFIQTLGTIDSVRSKDPSGCIILIDNSLDPLSEEQKTILNNRCDYFIEYPHNLFSEFCNKTFYFSKSISEVLMTDLFLKTVRENNLIGRRCFKVNGRYTLTESFDINFYSNPDFVGKYVYKNVVWWFKDPNSDNIQFKDFFETKLWSFCGSLFDEYESLLPKIFEMIIVDKENIEVSHNLVLPKEKKIEIPVLHLRGVHPNGAPVEV